MASERGYGKHLTLDGYNCERVALADLSAIYHFLDQCPGLIGMTKIIPPYVFRYHAPVPEDWGISGVVLIAESHISVHTYPEKHYLSLDVFSCKDFDHEAVAGFAIELFSIGEQEVNVIRRGLNFPK